MNKKISLLAGLFVFQLLLVLVINLVNHGQTNNFQASNLLQLSNKTIDKLVINDGNKTITIEKQNQYWRLPDSFGLKASQSKVEGLIKKLEKLTTSWPVATTSSSHQRFEVDNNKFQRKLEIYNQGVVVDTLYVGTSSGFKKSHLRAQQGDDVYALNLNDYELPLSTKDWLDKSILKIDKPVTVKGADFELVNQTNNWKLADEKSDEKLDVAKVNNLVNALKNITITDIADGKISFNDNPIELQINTQGDNIDLQLFSLNDKYFIKHSKFKPIFEIQKNTFETVKKIGRSDLLTTT